RHPTPLIDDTPILTVQAIRHHRFADFPTESFMAGSAHPRPAPGRQAGRFFCSMYCQTIDSDVQMASATATRADQP
ncbi:hypothetical protein, partial [Streptomyces sp. NPDC047009]|uniref:hypothetical protein n=1 Tax=Streptomyces sp. NPDC047009 TaxID=3154496 RepID=UPI003403E122